MNPRPFSHGRTFLLLLLTLPLGSGKGLLATEPGPTQMIQTSNEAMRVVLEEHPGDDQAVFAVLDRYTDFAHLSQEAISVLKDRLSPEQLRRLDKSFQDLLRLSSIRKAGRYRATAFTYVGEEIRSQNATVETLARYREDEVGLTYHLRRKGSSWIIVNYVVDGVDTARNYRKQFLSLFNRKGAEGLLAQIARKVEQLREADS